jgi:hypothetical protein
MRHGLAVALALGLFGAAAGAQEARPAVAEPTPPAVILPPALDRVLRDYEAAWRDGDGARLASLFTDDGFAVQSGSPLARGRTAIAGNIKGPGGALQLTAYAYAVDGGVGYIVGGYRYPQTSGPGGRFVLALRLGADGAGSSPQTSTTAAHGVSHGCFRRDYSSPLAPDHATVVPPTGGSDSATVPATPASATAPQSEAVTPAHWNSTPESRVPSSRPAAFAM